MKVMMVAGGSGGHIYPCLELAKYFKNKGDEVILGGANNSLEEKIYKDNGFHFIGVDIDKSKVSSYFKNYKKIKIIYKELNIDIVILFGNYISVSFGVAAILNKIPIYLHEQNVIYGRANKLLGLKAKKIYLSLPIKKDPFLKKSVLVGNPKGESRTNKVNLDKRNYNVVIAMGSQGSTSINKLLKELTKKATSNNVNYHIVVGKKYYDDFIKNIAVKDNIHIYPYLENLIGYIKECDIFVSRAGATTISEIINNEVVSILIPSPYVKDNHQYLNAKYLFDNDACLLLEEKNVDSDSINKEIISLLENNKRRLKIKENIAKLKIIDTKKKIYEDIKSDYTR